MLAKKSRKPKLILTLKPGAGLAPPVLGGNLGAAAREATLPGGGVLPRGATRADLPLPPQTGAGGGRPS